MNVSGLVGLVGEGVVVTLVVVLSTAEMEEGELDLIPRRREEEDDLLGFRENGRENLEIGNGDLEEEGDGLVEKEIEEDVVVVVVAAAMVQEKDEQEIEKQRRRRDL
jgi:hypothetical protein